MYYHMVGRVASVVSPFYSILLGLNPVINLAALYVNRWERILEEVIISATGEKIRP